MYFSPFDFAMIIAYIMLVFFIALQANLFMKRHSLIARRRGLRHIDNHYLAGQSITFWEGLLSILAAEFSALAFLTIPTYVYFGNLNYMKFVVGACISRLLISIFFVPKIYGQGLTIFEVLARGVHAYPTVNRLGKQGKRVFAFLYIITKTIGVSLKLLGGAILVAHFFEIPFLFSILFIALMTYLYTILGGLKAVVRTDMLQFSIFIIGGVTAHYVIGHMSTTPWTELITYGWTNGKFALFDNDGVLTFIYGMLAGFIYDAATHGVDQDISQKILGSTSKETAQKIIRWSAVGSFLVNFLFLSLGGVLWAFYNRQGLALPPVEELFSNLIEKNFPTPMKGLMVASVLAACMSSLDSSINAMSAVFWNDLMGTERSKLFRVYVNVDNFIITISIIAAAYIFSLIPEVSRFGLYFAYLVTGPLLAFFVTRMFFSKFIKMSCSPSAVILSFFACFLGMALNEFKFGFNSQLTIVWGLFTAFAFLWIYAKVIDFFQPTADEE